jgi:tetratricopeptide (TPR) repeat protein
MNRRLRQFEDCPQQATAFSQHLDTAEEYLSVDNTELSSRLRVSNSFIEAIDILLHRIGTAPSVEHATMRVLIGRRLEGVLERMRDAVESGRVCSETKGYDFLDRLIDNNSLYHRVVSQLKGVFSYRERIEILKEAIRFSDSVANPVAWKTFKAITFGALASVYAVARDFEKAIETLEEAYLWRSQDVGPDESVLQNITFQLCSYLASTGKYDRMLEYLQVAVDCLISGADASVVTVPSFSYTPCEALLLAASSSFLCILHLPLDHAQRQDIFAKTFNMIFECLEKCIEVTSAASSRLAGGIPYKLNVFADRPIPLDIEFDSKKLLQLFCKLYDLYRYPTTEKEGLRRVYNDMVVTWDYYRLKCHEVFMDVKLADSVVERLVDFTETYEGPFFWSDLRTEGIAVFLLGHSIQHTAYSILREYN